MRLVSWTLQSSSETVKSRRIWAPSPLTSHPPTAISLELGNCLCTGWYGVKRGTGISKAQRALPYQTRTRGHFLPAGNPLRHQALFTCLSGISRVVGKVVIRYAGGPHWTQSRLKIHPGGRDSTSCTRVWHWVEEHTAGNQRPHPLESGRRTHSRDGEQEVTGCYPITAGAPLCFTWDPVTTKEIQCQIRGI